MWKDIEQKKRKLDSIRPLTPRSLAVLDDWYDVELTYTSNAIEGNPLTAAEYAFALMMIEERVPLDRTAEFTKEFMHREDLAKAGDPAA